MTVLIILEILIQISMEDGQQMALESDCTVQCIAFDAITKKLNIYDYGQLRSASLV